MPSFIPAPPTKEFFIPAIGGTESSILGYRQGYLIDHDGDVAGIEFMVSHDFHNLVNAEVAWVAKAAVTNMYMDVLIHYGGHDRGYAAHTGATNITRTTELNRSYRNNIAAALTALSPLDHVGIRVRRPANGNANALILGVRIRYT